MGTVPVYKEAYTLQDFSGGWKGLCVCICKWVCRCAALIVLVGYTSAHYSPRSGAVSIFCPWWCCPKYSFLHFPVGRQIHLLLKERIQEYKIEDNVKVMSKPTPGDLLQTSSFKPVPIYLALPWILGHARNDRTLKNQNTIVQGSLSCDSGPTTGPPQAIQLAAI